MGKGEGDMRVKEALFLYIPQHCLNFMKMLCSTIKFSKDFLDVDHL